MKMQEEPTLASLTWDVIAIFAHYRKNLFMYNANILHLMQQFVGHLLQSLLMSSGEITNPGIKHTKYFTHVNE